MNPINYLPKDRQFVFETKIMRATINLAGAGSHADIFRNFLNNSELYLFSIAFDYFFWLTGTGLIAPREASTVYLGRLDVGNLSSSTPFAPVWDQLSGMGTSSPANGTVITMPNPSYREFVPLKAIDGFEFSANFQNTTAIDSNMTYQVIACFARCKL